MITNDIDFWNVTQGEAEKFQHPRNLSQTLNGLVGGYMKKVADRTQQEGGLWL
jgi:hypothetical protein